MNVGVYKFASSTRW